MIQNMETISGITGITKECIALVAEHSLEWQCGESKNQIDNGCNDLIASISVHSSDFELELLVAFSVDDVRCITHKLMMFEDGEELPNDVDLDDAACEVANMTAGEIKKFIHKYDPTVAIGLPKMVDAAYLNSVNESSHQQSSTVIQFGPTTAKIVLSIQRKVTLE